MNALTQVIHGRQMLFPEAIQGLQHHRLLEVAQHLFADQLFLVGIELGGFVQNALAQLLFVQLVIFRQPLLQWQIQREVCLQARFQARHVPHLFQRLGRNVLVDHRAVDVVTDNVDGLGNVVGIQQLVTLLVDHLALVVGNVIKLQQALADVEVAAFHLALGIFDRLGDPRVLDGFALFHAQLLHHAGHAVGGEDPHQGIFHGEVETGGARVTLTTGTAAQLVVDTTGFVTLGADNVQTTGGQHRIVTHLPGGFQLGNLLAGRVLQLGDLCLPVTAQHDVGTTTGHVGGDGDRTCLTGLGNDLRFHGVELGVQHLVRDLLLGQDAGEQLGVLDRDGTNQYRLAALHTLTDIFDDGGILLIGGQVDQIAHVLAHHWFVGRDNHGIQAINLLEFKGFGIRSTGHARQLVVETEVVLEGDGGQRLVLVLDLHPFLRFNGLMQTIRPATTRHGTAGVLVNDDDLVFLDDIVHVAFEQGVSAQTRIDVVQQADVGGGEQGIVLVQQPLFLEQLFHEDLTVFGQQGLTVLLIHRVVTVAGVFFGVFLVLLDQQRDQLVDADIEL